MIKVIIKFLLILILASNALLALPSQYKNAKPKFRIDIPDSWHVTQHDLTSISEPVLVATKDNSMIVISADVLTADDEKHNFKKIKLKRKSRYNIENATCIHEEYPAFYSLMGNRIIRTFELNDGRFVKQFLIVRSKSVLIINVLNATSNFDETDAIVNTIKAPQSVTDGFYRLKSAREIETLPLFGLAILLIHTGYLFDKYRHKCKYRTFHYKPEYKTRFVITITLSIVLFGLVFFLFKENVLFAIIIIIFYLVMWLIMQNTPFSRRLNYIVKRIGIDYK